MTLYKVVYDFNTPEEPKFISKELADAYRPSQDVTDNGWAASKEEALQFYRNQLGEKVQELKQRLALLREMMERDKC